MSRGYADLADGNQAARVLLVGTDYDSSMGGVVQVAGTLAGVNPGVIEAAGNYTAGDVLSNSDTASAGVAWVFDAVVGANGGSGLITRVLATASAEGLLCRLRLWLFNANPSGSELDDNEALSIVVADRAKLIGYVDLPALADVGTMTIAQNVDVRLPFVCAAADDALYGILQALDAETNEAGSMTVSLTLQVSRD